MTKFWLITITVKGKSVTLSNIHTSLVSLVLCHLSGIKKQNSGQDDFY